MLEEIKGVGDKTIQELNHLNIDSIEGLLTYYPYRYNFYNPSNIKNSVANETIVITGMIESIPKIAFIRRNFNKLSFKLNANESIINAVIYNRAFIKQHLMLGTNITLIGKYNQKTNVFTANDIKLKPILAPEFEPVYHLTSGIKKASFNKIIQSLLSKNYYVPNYVPAYLTVKYDFIDKLTALKYIHKPLNANQIKQAKLMLIYEEFFSFMLKINYLKMKKQLHHKAVKKNYNEKLLEKFIDKLPYTLTQDQVNALEDIKDDINSSKRMNRLLLGDVGSGKTIIAFLSLFINYLAGYQGVLMAPTEILAIQHYNNALEVFKNETLNIVLLTSSTKKKEKEQIINDLRDNKIDMIIGTHSVLNSEINIINLGLVITDEQHRFGVKQRQNLQQKGNKVDVLYLSATPIPRTLALTIYGDVDISQIKNKPMNNKDIITKLIKNNNIKEVLSSMLEEIKKGHQIFVIVPLIEDNEELNMENVESINQKINAAFNNKIPTEILHGKLKSKEKDLIMKRFLENEIKILISTTVIEVGIDIKNATMMVIFNAERFGLATLHQLRGRVGRNDFQSYCYIISDSESERLKVMEESNDGFYISEKDFEIRGHGDLFGIKQSGDMNFKIADLKNDFKILLQCKKDSEEFLNNQLININEFPDQKRIIEDIVFID